MSNILQKFIIKKDDSLCDDCGACIKQCSFGVYDKNENGIVKTNSDRCVGCYRCVVTCPRDAIEVKKKSSKYHTNFNWTEESITDIKKQAESGGMLLTSMGNDKKQRIYWDHMLLNASQVTNPPIDPLREPMELVTYLGKKPTFNLEGSGSYAEYPSVKIDIPIVFSAMSYGAVGLNVHKALAEAAKENGTLWNTGEGGLHSSLMGYKENTVVQVASGRYGVTSEYMNSASMVEIKIGQGAKPGIGGHLPGKKVTQDISNTRMIPVNSDAISPAPHHDIYSIEDLAQLISVLKEATDYKKPIAVKVAAVHNIAAIASGVVRAGADVIVIDGYRGSTGAAPKVMRDNVGIPIELALAAVDERLRQESIRDSASIIVSGGIRNSADVAKAIALGADAVSIGTAALIALGCCMCQQCHTGKCAWGICTTDEGLSKRLRPEKGAKMLSNLLRGWSLEIKDMMGAMGINSIDSLRGNRLQLRGINLSESEAQILGIRMAGT